MVHEIFAVQNGQSWFIKLKSLKSLVKSPVFARALNAIKIYECRSGRMIPILLLKLSLYNLTGILCKIRDYQNNAKAN